jgi:4-hydroxyproline epimerase
MADIAAFAGELRWSPVLRRAPQREIRLRAPGKPAIAGLATSCGPGKPRHPAPTPRNAVFYGDKAIDRSPCGTGTSARMAQLHAARGG